MASHFVSRSDIWNFFLTLFGGNEYATAGACGNVQWESSLATDNAENSWNSMTGHSDEWLTERINNGTIDLNEFLKKEWYVNSYGFGYGLSQWTTSDRRTKLWERTIGQGVNIDDVNAQLGYIEWEFTNGSWAGVRNKLQTVTSVHDATYIYCKEYEGGTWSSTRETYAQSFYDDYAGSSSGYQIRIHAQGNCSPYASTNITGSDTIYYAEAGSNVFIHANVGDGDYFEIWTSDYGGATIDNVTNENTFFIMPSSVVDITAHATGTTPDPSPYPPEPPTPTLNPNLHKMPIWLYPVMRC